MSEEEGDLLDIFLSTAAEEIGTSEKSKVLKETNIFTSETNINIDAELHTNLTSKKNNENKSLIHSGDTDSSDDEGNKNYQESKYNECGKGIKKLLASSYNTSSSFSYENGRKQRIWKSKVNDSLSTSSSKGKPNVKVNDSLSASSSKGKPNVAFKTKINTNISTTTTNFKNDKSDAYMDPIFGIRIINPLISSSVIQDRMAGRDAVPFAQLVGYLKTKPKDKDWVIGGVIANKSPVKTSQKGTQFIILTLSDLKVDIKTVSLFLFGSAFKELWKTVVGTVIGVLNPSILDKRDGSKDEAVLSVDNPQRVMLFGTSKDLGTCKSVKKNGEKCTSIVNKTNCEFCIYHIKQEYQKCSLRSELQSNFAGRGLIALRNKVLGKNEVFYAGKSYTAIPAKRSKKLEQKDNNRLESLSGNTRAKQPKNTTVSKKKQAAAKLEMSPAQRQRDLELLKKLAGPMDMESKNNFTGTRSTEPTLEESKSTAITIINKLKQTNKEEEKVFNSQYDMTSDLIVNVENKNNFNGKMSQEVNFEGSKSKALDVIDKLRKKHSEKEKVVGQNLESNKVDDELHAMCDDFFADDLNYDDLDINESKDNSKNLENSYKGKGKSLITDKDVSTNKSKGNSKNLADNKDRRLNKVLEKGKGKTNLSAINNNLIKTKTTENNRERNYEISKNGDNSSISNSSSLNNNNQNKPDVKFSSTLLNSTIPTLKTFGGFLDLNKPGPSRKIDSSKLKALKFIQENGPLKKTDPNNTKGSGKKRIIDETEFNSTSENEPKKSKISNSEFISDRFKKMMAATSKHTDLLEARDNEEQEKYFHKQEMKEKMEEKMANTFKVACKAVRCLKCKYTSFSASDFCKKEGHPLKVFDTMKRFFKCGNCGNRTVSLEIVPTVPCKNCGSGKWEKTGMMKEKIATAAHTLSIRGGEQKFFNSVVTEANLNLMVPDE